MRLRCKHTHRETYGRIVRTMGRVGTFRAIQFVPDADVVLHNIVSYSHVRIIQYNKLCRNTHSHMESQPNRGSQGVAFDLSGTYSERKGCCKAMHTNREYKDNTRGHTLAESHFAN